MATPPARLGPVTPSVLAQMELAGAGDDAAFDGGSSASTTGRIPSLAAAAPRGRGSGFEQVVVADELDDEESVGSAEPVEYHKRMRTQPPEECALSTPLPCDRHKIFPKLACYCIDMVHDCPTRRNIAPRALALLHS